MKDIKNDCMTTNHFIFKKYQCLDCTFIRQTNDVGLCLTCKTKLLKFRNYAKLQMRKWRKANPRLALELGRKHQTTWRNKHPDLNRLRARLGQQKRRLLNGSRS